MLQFAQKGFLSPHGHFIRRNFTYSKSCRHSGHSSPFWCRAFLAVQPDHQRYRFDFLFLLHALSFPLCRSLMRTDIQKNLFPSFSYANYIRKKKRAATRIEMKVGRFGFPLPAERLFPSVGIIAGDGKNVKSFNRRFWEFFSRRSAAPTKRADLSARFFNVPRSAKRASSHKCPLFPSVLRACPAPRRFRPVRRRSFRPPPPSACDAR